jgi:manganese/zinc/iron transport system permease protein
VAPAAAARQWTDRMGLMIFLSALFGALAGVSGAVLSSNVARLPTGPTIVLCITGLVIVSLLIAPNRGLLWNWLRQFQNQKRLRSEAVLADLYVLAAQHESAEHSHPTTVLEAMNPGRSGVLNSLKELEARGWVRMAGAEDWALTPSGRDEAERLLKESPGWQGHIVDDLPEADDTTSPRMKMEPR